MTDSSNTIMITDDIKAEDDGSSPSSPIAVNKEELLVVAKTEEEGLDEEEMTIVATTTEDEDEMTTATTTTQQIYVIETADGLVPVETAEVVVAEDMAVYETVSALEQLSRGNGDDDSPVNNGNMLQVYEEVVLAGNGETATSGDYVNVQEVQVGNGRSSSPIKVGILDVRAALNGSGGGSGSQPVDSGTLGGEFQICRLCNQFVLVGDIAAHNKEHHGSMKDLTCVDCAKIFKSKRSLFGHRKEKHSGVIESHSCPECGKNFGRKSNLKAHRESLHYGKKFTCNFCDRVFTNRSSMNQHIKKTHKNNDNATTTTSIVISQ